MRDYDYGFGDYYFGRDRTILNANIKKVEEAFSREAMSRICEMPERGFAEAYDMDIYKVPQKAPDDFFFYRDNGSNILAVAHLDTVGLADERACHFVDTEGGPVVFSRALDDRLGATIILDILPKLGLNFDILLTVGEENGKSTAAFFEPEKHYDWMIEFDRGGTDVVMYQYEDSQTIDLVKESGARVGDGIFSDISYMEHMGIKGFNWGVGYQDYHGPRAHAYLEDTFMMVAHFLKFYEANSETHLPHEEIRVSSDWATGNWWSSYRGRDDDYEPYVKTGVDVDDDVPIELERECDRIFGTGHMHDDDECAQIIAEFAEDPEVAEAGG